MRKVVRWGQEPLAFELATADVALAARARRVFAPWAAGAALPTAARFAVERVAATGQGCDPADGSAWEVRADDGQRTRTRTAEEALRWVELAAIQSFVPCCDGDLALHGALVDFDGRAVLIVGPARAGKSSLACGLWRAGGALLSDDVALLDLATALARPGPRRVALRDGSAELLGAELWQRIRSAPSSAPTDEGWCFYPGEIDGRARPHATRVAVVVFLGREGRPELAPATIVPIVPACAVLSLLPYVVAQRRLDPGEAIRRIAPLAARVSAFDLARGPLEAMVQRTRAALGEVA